MPTTTGNSGNHAPAVEYSELVALIQRGMRARSLRDRRALRMALQSHGLTVSRQTVDNWTTGASAPSGRKAAVLMRVCGVVTLQGELEWWRACANLPANWHTLAVVK
jgi:hypothetical protein